MPVSNTLPEVGSRIYAIGSPNGLTGTISEGIVSSIRNMEGIEMIQITAPISPGSSGGPVLDNNGNVIGIAKGTFSSGQNLNFAVPSKLIKALRLNAGATVTQLNIEARQKAVSAGIPRDLREGLEIHDYFFRERDYGSYLERQLRSFSIRNNTDYSIYDVKLLIILMNGAGQPIDYHELTFLSVAETERYKSNKQEYIKPRMSRMVDLGDVAKSELEFHNKRVFRLMKSSEKIIVRVLDFKIGEY
jgi:hypothetical protein